MIGYEKINCRKSQWIKAGYEWLCHGYPFISKKEILSYPKRYPFISVNDILEISSIRDISGYIRIYQDISGYLFGANSQMFSPLPSKTALILARSALFCEVLSPHPGYPPLPPPPPLPPHLIS
jgi:hypothetical protein